MFPYAIPANWLRRSICSIIYLAGLFSEASMDCLHLGSLLVWWTLSLYKYGQKKSVLFLFCHYSASVLSFSPVFSSQISDTVIYQRYIPCRFLSSHDGSPPEIIAKHFIRVEHLPDVFLYLSSSIVDLMLISFCLTLLVASSWFPFAYRISRCYCCNICSIAFW